LLADRHVLQQRAVGNRCELLQPASCFDQAAAAAAGLVTTAHWTHVLQAEACTDAVAVAVASCKTAMSLTLAYECNPCAAIVVSRIGQVGFFLAGDRQGHGAEQP